MPKIAVLHTAPVTVGSLKPLFAQHLPGVDICNFLDDSILPEINGCGRITESVRARFYLLAQCAAAVKPALILSACSSVGGLLAECRAFLGVPLYRIDEPMAQAAVSSAKRIAVAATLASTLDPTCALLECKAQEAGKAIALTRILIDGAGALLAAGKTAEYEGLIVASLAHQGRDCDMIVLAQASMAGAAARLTACPVLSSPEMGIAFLKGVLHGC